MSAHNALQWLEAELEPRRNAEVFAAASEPPGALVLVPPGLDDRPIRRHELRADEVVARETVLCCQVTDAAAQREPADAGGTDDTSR